AAFYGRLLRPVGKCICPPMVGCRYLASHTRIHHRRAAMALPPARQSRQRIGLAVSVSHRRVRHCGGPDERTPFLAYICWRSARFSRSLPGTAHEDGQKITFSTCRAPFLFHLGEDSYIFSHTVAPAETRRHLLLAGPVTDGQTFPSTFDTVDRSPGYAPDRGHVRYQKIATVH